MKIFKQLLKYFIIIFIILIVLILGTNFFVILTTKKNILSEEQVSSNSDIDCILVLGAGVWQNKPSHMLEDRLLQAVSLYNNNVASKIIVSGDHGQEDYDEVNVMKSFLIEHGIPSEDIFMDHAGFSSYDSIYRAKEIFKVKKLVIVTQKYHLYRSIYIAKSLNLTAYGVASNPRSYSGQIFREIREILARNKDVVKCIFKPNPKYLGETIPVSGNGDITNDKDI